MKENGFIADIEYENALQEKVEFKDEAAAGIKAPHFVFMSASTSKKSMEQMQSREGAFK